MHNHILLNASASAASQLCKVPGYSFTLQPPVNYTLLHCSTRLQINISTRLTGV